MTTVTIEVSDTVVILARSEADRTGKTIEEVLSGYLEQYGAGHPLQQLDSDTSFALPWEDNLLERKVGGDTKDILKTLVAFANSVRPGHTAVLLIGEKDDDTVGGVQDPNRMQKYIREQCDKIYPPILWRSRVYEKAGKFCVRVEIEYSGETPHFGGPAWVRKGSETIKATDEVFQRLIELRLEKVRELARWLNQEITIHLLAPTGPSGQYNTSFRGPGKLIFVNRFWITYENNQSGKVSYPVDRVSLSYDNQDNRLLVLVKKR